MATPAAPAPSTPAAAPAPADAVPAPAAPAAEDEALNAVSEYDLTPRFLVYLERHLGLPLLEFLGTQKMYPASELLRGRLEMLGKTCMVDSAEEVLEELRKRGTASDEFYAAKTAELKARRDEVMKQFHKLAAEAQPIVSIIDNVERVDKLKAENNFNLAYLKQAHNITEANAQAMFEYARFRFDCGYYEMSLRYLQHYRLLFPASESTVTAMWGELASSILCQNQDNALELLTKLRDSIDASKLTPVQQLEQRTWLLHWSIFVYFKHPNGRNAIFDLFQDRYMNAVQTTCPYLLRYVTAAAIINKRRRNVLKELVRVLKQESYEHRDPITEFFEDLNVNFDFEAAQRKLRECEKVLANDWFLSGVRDEFLENARLFIFETYCRIHQRIDMGMLSGKLGMNQDEAERWIVNLIRNARLDAKIDSKNAHVVMGSQCPNVYQQVIEKTKMISTSSYMLAHNISQLLSPRPAGQQQQRRGGPQQLPQQPQQQQQRSAPAAASAQAAGAPAPAAAQPQRASEEVLAESLAAVTADD
eukprot:m51a1_g7943 putative eukaryotic translation initiation factor 3 subunit e (532) ;mRNA; f:115370-117477